MNINLLQQTHVSMAALARTDVVRANLDALT